MAFGHRTRARTRSLSAFAIGRVIAAGVAVGVQVLPLRAADPPLLAQILAQAGEQVRKFEQNFAIVISDEDYQQHAGGRRYLGPEHRRTRAEMLFFWLPDEAVWLTVRNVVSVDGRSVAGNPNRLQDALAEAGDERVSHLRRLVDESARFNIGKTFRNFNYPTLVLSYLDPALQPRFAFTLAGRQRVQGTDSWKVNYVERSTPTLIKGDGVDCISRGSVWIADRDHVLVRTRLELMIPRADSTSAWSTAEVEYRPESRLQMWVPVRMRETYTETRGSWVEENIGAEASYSNFRRFETSGRLVVPQ